MGTGGGRGRGDSLQDVTSNPFSHLASPLARNFSKALARTRTEYVAFEGAAAATSHGMLSGLELRQPQQVPIVA